VGSYEVKEIMRNYLIISKDGQKKILSYPLISNETANPKAVTQSSEFSKKEIERLTKDPGVLFQEIRLKPSVEEGKTRGFIFEWIKPRSIFDKAGIKQGDVLVAINNIEIKSGEDAFRILQALRNESSLKVTLLRDGQNMDINLRVK
jgi:general secretion pathway protein C